jgi:hypothetical protein
MTGIEIINNDGEGRAGTLADELRGISGLPIPFNALCYPSLTIALRAARWIDFVAGLNRLLDRRKAGAVARRTYLFNYGRVPLQSVHQRTPILLFGDYFS